MRKLALVSSFLGLSLTLYSLAKRRKVGGGQALSKPWRRLRAEVGRAGFTLTPGVFEQIQRLYLSEYADGKKTPAGLTSEYEQDEFLQAMDCEGRLCMPTTGMLRQWQETVEAHPGFTRWLREAYREDGTPVLLPARWLCHLVGLCHATVEIFIDPPGLAGHTLVQVRGMEKFEAPGAWDIPCAGHISEMDAVETALRKELSEELNLALEDLDNLRLTGRYASCRVPIYRTGRNGKINNEYRVLYQATLKAEAAAKIRFADGEVAGLAVFAVPELRILLKRSPERVASGLSGAIDFYQEE